MTKIHINSFIGDENPLELDAIPEGLDTCALKLEELANEYREMATYFRDKKPKVLSVEGYPHCGSFTIDEIDTERLKQDGKVTDFSDNPDNDNPLFSIDSELDKVLDSMDTEFEDDDDRAIKTGSDTISLASLLLNQDGGPDFDDGGPGTINLEVEKTDEGEYSFYLRVFDFGNRLPNIQFQREEGVFKYRCGSCEEEHSQSLENVYSSLRTGASLIGNFAYLARDNKEFCMALTALDDDLRLLSHLISFDYALDDDQSPE
jgi:hypothetical protein